jgi:hypothetical protein
MKAIASKVKGLTVPARSYIRLASLSLFHCDRLRAVSGRIRADGGGLSTATMVCVRVASLGSDRVRQKSALWRSVRRTTAGIDLSDREWLREILRGRRTVTLPDVEVSAIRQSRPGLPIGAPISDGRGGLRGAVVAGSDSTPSRPSRTGSGSDGPDSPR